MHSSVPGESRITGKFAGWTPEEAYTLLRDWMRQEGSRFLEERPPTHLVATQGHGRFLRRFELSFDPDPDGPTLRGRVTSAEDWPAHERRALIRVGAGLGLLILGIVAAGASLAARLGDVALIGSILLLSAGVPVAVAGHGLYRSAKLLAKGESVPFWLGSTKP